MKSNKDIKKTDPNNFSGQLETIVVSKKYFSNMQKMMNRLLPKLHIENVSVLREFLSVYDWMDAEKVEKESSNHKDIRFSSHQGFDTKNDSNFKRVGEKDVQSSTAQNDRGQPRMAFGRRPRIWNH